MAKIKLSAQDYRHVTGLDWPDSWETECIFERVNGGEWIEGGIDADQLADSDTVEINGGEIIAWDDKIRPPRGGYVGWIKANLSKLSERRIVVTCDAEKFDAVIAAIKKAGGRS